MKVAKSGSITSETTSFDSAIILTGFGKFHIETIAVCSLSVLVVGFQNGLSSYVFPAAQCELNLDSFQLGLLNVAFLLGGALSCFLFGTLADMLGRRPVLIGTHLLNSAVTILSSTNPTVHSLIVCRFFNGFLIGGPGSIIYAYISEFQPPKYRTMSVCYCGLFFTLAWLLLPVLAYLVLPLNVNLKVGGFFVLSPWRLFLIILSLPEITVGLWLIRLPESPKFYVAKGYPRKALVVLRKMYSSNSGKGPESFPVKNIITEVNIEVSSGSKVTCRGQIARVMSEVVDQMKSLFQRHLIGRTVLISGIMFSNMFGMFGLGLWLPDLLIKFEQYRSLHPNDTISLKELSYLREERNISCTPSFEPSVIQSTVAMGVTALVLSGCACWASTKTSAKNISLVAMTIGGVSSGLIYWMSSSLQNLIIACIFQSTMIISNMSISGIAVELFPTKVNGVAICFVLCIGRIAAGLSNVLFGYLMDSQCEIPIFTVAAVVTLGGGACLLVPNAKREDVVQTRKGFEKEVEIAVISDRFR
nr:synaptic vesicle glycoprotein 2B-like [Leptinotarsa decemlineata]